MVSIKTQSQETEASLSGEANPEREMILLYASIFDPMLSDVFTCSTLSRQMTASAACGDATPSNKPLEWTGRLRVRFDSNCFLPATQGQRSKERGDGY